MPFYCLKATTTETHSTRTTLIPFSMQVNAATTMRTCATSLKTLQSTSPHLHMFHPSCFQPNTAVGFVLQSHRHVQERGCCLDTSCCLLGLFHATAVHHSTSSFRCKFTSTHAAPPLISCCLNTANHQIHNALLKSVLKTLM